MYGRWMAEARLYRYPRCEVEVMTWIGGKEYPEGGALSLMSRGEGDARIIVCATRPGSGRAAGRAPSRRPAAGTRGLAAVDRRAIDRGPASIPNRPGRRGPDVRPRRVGRLGELRRAGLEKPRRRCDPPAGLLHCQIHAVDVPTPHWETRRAWTPPNHLSSASGAASRSRLADHFQVLTARDKGRPGRSRARSSTRSAGPAWAEAQRDRVSR